MTTASFSLRELVIDLISPVRQPDPAKLARLSDADWDALLAIAVEHRLLPLMHARLRDSGTDWLVPKPVRQACADAFRQQSLRAMMALRTLAQCLRALSPHGIRVVALKGAWLAFEAYPQPGLRPLRDIDLLVDRAEARKAFGILVEAGLQPVFGEIGDLEAFMAIKHQLPALWCPDNGVCVELHHRCFHGGDNEPDLSDDPAFKAHLVEGAVGGSAVHYMGREHLMLHLIVHSAMDHMFDNGPLVMPDIAMLLATGPFDWTLFWGLAARFDAVAAAILVLSMCERNWGVTGIEWQAHQARASAIPASLVTSATLLSLRPIDRSGALAHAARLDAQKTVRAKAAYVLRKIFPPTEVLRAAYPSGGGALSLPRLYVRRWQDSLQRHRLGTKTAPSQDRPGLKELSDWLQHDPTA